MFNKENKTASPRVEPKLSVLRPTLRPLRHLPACLPITSEKKVFIFKAFFRAILSVYAVRSRNYLFQSFFFALFGSLVGKKTLFRMKGRSIYRAETTSHFDSPQEQPSLPSAEVHVENATQVTCGTRFVNSRGGEGREVGHSMKV